MTQTILNEQFITKNGNLLEIRITELRGKIETRIVFNKMMISENSSWVWLKDGDEVQIPITDKRKIGDLKEEIVRMKNKLDAFFEADKE